MIIFLLYLLSSLRKYKSSILNKNKYIYILKTLNTNIPFHTSYIYGHIVKLRLSVSM